jgi:hypothetical protein
MRSKPMTIWEPQRARVAIARGAANHDKDEIELDLSYEEAHSLFLELGTFLMTHRCTDRVSEAIDVLGAYHDEVQTADPKVPFQQWIADPENANVAALRQHYADGRNWAADGLAKRSS